MKAELNGFDYQKVRIDKRDGKFVCGACETAFSDRLDFLTHLGQDHANDLMNCNFFRATL